jgi:ribosome-binding factor A
VKKKFSSLAKNQLRVIPDFEFYIDDSLDYIDEIDKALKGGDNPIK